MKLFHDPGFAAPLGEHIMPISKFELVAAEIRRLWPDWTIWAPEPVTDADLFRVHDPAYVEAVKTGEPRSLAESQKFPWSPELFPSVCLTNGGVFAAASEALKSGSSAALASGFHHAHRSRGEGFCTFNGLVVAGEKLRAERGIQRVAVLDLDLHYGNGTALLAKDRPWLRALSIYGNDYWENVPYRDVSVRRHADGPNHRSVAVNPTGGSDRETLLLTVEQELPWLIDGAKPEVLLYQAGADPLRDDPYSPLDLTHDDLLERDRVVFRFAKGHGIPVAWVLAGGYSKDIRQIVQAHVNTARAWAEIFD
ncbi:MAG: histone deacetylase [Terrimicrobiaceae bacterium]|nr:histone deacetylase [Terrimicrobiaceae bacterium]